MKLAELNYDLPPERIAQTPCAQRDASRLLVLDRATGALEHRVFRDLPRYLRAGDCLVLNDTRVVPARFFCKRATGGRVEGLFLHAEPPAWRVLLKPSARLKVGESLRCAAEVVLQIVARAERGEWLVRPEPERPALELLGRIGQTPLPPYIHRDAAGAPPLSDADAERYQTVYARQPGAVAAPTAGLHFTPELLAAIERQGVRIVRVTLHVGAGTFVPIEAEDLADHRMHAEWFEVSPTAAATLGATRAAGGRIFAVGTTATRVLETLGQGVAAGMPAPPPAAMSGWTDIFIHPPHAFRYVDGMITNFHLPGSTLLALVMALASPAQIRAAYAAAIAAEYRFYSYGDAMLIL